MFKQAKDLLSFRAFKPSKLDIKVPLAERFCKGGPLMGVSMSRNSLTCAEIEFKYGTEASVSKIKTLSINWNGQETSANEEQIKAITAFARENGLFHVVLLNSPDMQIVKLDGSIKTNADSLYNESYSMAKILEEQSEEGRVHVYVSNPKFDETLIFSYKQFKIDNSAFLINGAGLEVVRAGCSIYAVTNYLMNVRPEFLSNDQILLIYSGDSLIIASVCENRFQQISFRANIEKQDVEVHISKMIERFDHKHSQASYINGSDWDVQNYFSLNYPSLKVDPVFENSFEGIFQAACHG